MPLKAPIIYLPVESKNRELASRVLLARYLLRSGFRVVIGYNQTVVSGSRWFPRGIYLIKGLNAVQKRMAETFGKQGHRILAVDEEALGLSDEWFIAKNVDPEITSHVDLVFCQGQRQHRALKKHFAFKDAQLVLTGNSRVDFLRPPLKSIITEYSKDIRHRLGKFVLINTNSGSINNLWGDPRRYLGLLVEVGWYDPANPMDKTLVDEHLDHDQNNLIVLKSLIELLAEKRPDIRVVVRPHPSERSKVWEEIAIGKPSIMVVCDTDAPPWLDAADIVVTTGCTTGLEARLLNKPALSIVNEPLNHRFSTYFVANEVNPVLRSVEHAFEHVSSHWDGHMITMDVDTEARERSLAESLEVDDSVLATSKIAARIGNYAAQVTATDQDVYIHEDHETHLRKVVKRVQWDKGAFERREIDDWMTAFDQYLGATLPFDLREISWSAFEMTPTQ
jgi:surface carbohydrate biosynthesis protein